MVRTQLDWSPSHGPIWGAINGAGLALVAAGVGSVFPNMPPWYALPFAAVGAFATTYLGVRRGSSRANIVFWLLCWNTPAIWATVTIIIGWSFWSVGALLALALVAGIVGPDLGKHEPAVAVEAAEQAARGPEHAAWEARITRVCAFGQRVHVPKIEWWPDRVGYDVHVVFPAGSGYTWENLRARERELASAANNPKGCPVRAKDADFQGSAVLMVTRVNALKDEITYPREYGPLSVKDCHPLGLLADRKQALAEVRQSAGLVAGRRGTGKTNILDIFTANLLRCTDALVWHIDLNGGGMSVPWMLPYVAGMVDTPPIDWVARTPEEALLMTRVALAIAKDRKAAYGRLKALNNTRLLPVSATLPEIVIIVDEGAEVVGEDAEAATEVARNLRRLQRIGRAEAVNVIFSALRATGETIPVGVRKQCALRIGTKVEEDSELDYLFNYDRGLRSSDLMYPGCAYIRTEDMTSVEQMKAFHVLPEQIAEIVIATSNLRPAADPRAVTVGGRVYERRWDRTRPYLTALAGEDGELEIPDVEQPLDAGHDGDPVSRLAALTKQFQKDVQKSKQRRDPADEVLDMPPDKVSDEVASIFALDAFDPREDGPPPGAEPMNPLEALAHLDEAGMVEGLSEQDRETLRRAREAAKRPPSDVAARRELVREFVRRNGPVKTAAIIAYVKAEIADVAESTVYEWLKAEKADGYLHNPKQGVWVAEL